MTNLPLFNRMKRSVVSTQDFGVVEMQPRELYSGQLYAAIRTRANRVANLAKEHTDTRLFDEPDVELEGKDAHPYLQLINQSPSFANTYFWRAISTFLDLTGTAYIFVLRNYTEDGEIIGSPLEFKIINPYNLTRVTNENGEVGGYIETRGGMYRTIPKEQLIVIPSFNPFNLNDGYAMVEAAKEDHFNIKQARDYTRKAIKKNIGQRGLLTTELILKPEEYENFKQQIKSEDTGDFMFGNGPGAVKYTDTQIDLDKLALDKINGISIDVLIAVSGASKTLLGIEESGTTRDTARVQKDLFTENHAIPQLDDILDALNQDYKNSYKAEYEAKKVELFVDSPLKVDKEAELKDAQIEKQKADTAKVLIDTGFDAASVQTYLDLEELSFEGRQTADKPKLTIKMPDGSTDTGAEPTDEENSLLVVLNRFSPGLESVVRGYESTLQNQVSNIEGQILQAVIPKLSDTFKNQLEPDKAISAKDRKRLEHDLELAFAAFGVSIVALFAGQTINKRFAEFKLPAQFTMTPEVNKTINESAKLSSQSHVKTFVKATFDEARKAGQEGLSRDAIVSRLTGSFPDLSKVNATRIARTESYKAVNLAQYEADKQFLDQNGMTAKAYKRWTVQSSNPCPYCVAKDGDEVPFGDNFLDLGDSVKANFESKDGTVTREYVVGYEPITSGTLHPNCSCTYELVIRE